MNPTRVISPVELYHCRLSAVGEFDPTCASSCKKFVDWFESFPWGSVRIEEPWFSALLMQYVDAKCTPSLSGAEEQQVLVFALRSIHKRNEAMLSRVSRKQTVCLLRRVKDQETLQYIAKKEEVQLMPPINENGDLLDRPLTCAEIRDQIEAAIVLGEARGVFENFSSSHNSDSLPGTVSDLLPAPRICVTSTRKKGTIAISLCDRYHDPDEACEYVEINSFLDPMQCDAAFVHDGKYHYLVLTKDVDAEQKGLYVCEPVCKPEPIRAKTKADFLTFLKTVDPAKVIQRPRMLFEVTRLCARYGCRLPKYLGFMGLFLSRVSAASGRK